MLNPVPQLGVAPAVHPARTMAEMTPENFLKLLITQLQSQDPTKPVENQDLINQLSSIRQLQSNMDLSRTLASMGKQQQIVSAGALIGKHVDGLNGQAERVGGIVTSITVDNDNVVLELDTGQRVALKDVTRVSPVATGGTTPAGT
jgi:flagellar basal-body rod modification protein FlgD